VTEDDTDKGYGLHYYSLTGTNWWQIEIRDIKYGDRSVKETSIQSAIMDSGTSLIIVPYVDFNTLVNELQKSVPTEIYCSNELCFVEGNCSSHY
jgi:hypothetical protein